MRSALLALALLVSPACFATRAASPVHAGPEKTAVVVYALGIPFAGFPALGAECPAGIAYVEGAYGWRDGLWSLAYGAIGALVGGLICDSDENNCRTRGAVYGVGSLLIFQTRTVTYACRESSLSGAGLSPP